MRRLALAPASRYALSFAASAVLIGCGDDLATSASATDSDTSTSSSTSSSTDSTSSSSSGASATATVGGSESDSATTGDPTTTTDSTSGTTSGTTSGSTTGSTSAATATTGSTSDASTSDASSSSGGTDSSSTGTGTDSDTGGFVDCVDDNLPYTGSLCGPDQQPCEVAIDEAVEADHHFRNESPAVTFDNLCDPQVLFSVAEGGYHGFFAARDGEQSWPTAETPFPIARVGLAYDHDAEQTLALTYNGAFGTSLWSRGEDPWEEVAPLMGKQIASAHGFARDPAGPLHAAVVTDGNAPRHAVYDGDWTTDDLGEQAPASAAIALDAIGDPHITFWSSTEQTWKLYYAAPPQAPEEILALGSNVLNIQRQGVAAIPGDGDPLDVSALSLSAIQTQGGLHELVLSARLSPGVWKTETIVAENDDDAKLCQTEPLEPGQKCDYDYTRYLPLEIVASAGGDARFFYRYTRYVGTLIAECVQMPFPICSWVPLSDDNEAELRIGWPTEDGPEWTTLLSDAFFTDMTAVIDAQGRIHVAAYDSENFGETMVRYLRIE